MQSMLTLDGLRACSLEIAPSEIEPEGICDLSTLLFLQILVHKNSQNACIPAFIHVLMIGIVLQEIYFKRYVITPLLYH